MRLETPQPRAERSGRAQAPELAPGLDEGLLGEVLGEGGVAAEPAHQLSHHALAAADQLGEGLVVAGNGQGDDARLGRTGERGRTHYRFRPLDLRTSTLAMSSATPSNPTRQPTPTIG